MAGDTEKIVTEVKEAVDALRVEFEKGGLNSPEYKEMVDKTAKALEADEKCHQDFEKKQLDLDKKILDQEDRIKDFELQVAKLSSPEIVDYKTGPEYIALTNYVKHGPVRMDPDEFKTMRMDDATAGGYLTTTEMDNIIIKNIIEISPVRQISRVKTVGKKTLEIPKRTGIMEAFYEGEAEQNVTDQSTYGNETLTAYRLSVTVPFTMDLLGDAVFDLESEITGDVSESFAFKEGNRFVLGTGSKQPEGFLTKATLIAGARSSTTAGTIDADDLILLTGDLKVGYKPRYGFNRQTLAFFRTFKGTNGQYLWQAGLAPNVPNTINGEPYTLIQDMPVIANNSLSVVYGDFLRGYTITDRTGMTMIRDEVTAAGQAIIKLTFHRWNTGQVVLDEAFKLLKTKST